LSAVLLSTAGVSASATARSAPGCVGQSRIAVPGAAFQTTSCLPLEASYHVTFINDAVGDFTEQAHRAAVDVAFPTFGHESLTVDEFLSSVDA
jgi:nicotinamidase-related amidase